MPSDLLRASARLACAGTHSNDALELVGADVPVAILVEEVEGLAQTLALETLDELGELGVWV